MLLLSPKLKPPLGFWSNSSVFEWIILFFLVFLFFEIPFILWSHINIDQLITAIQVEDTECFISVCMDIYFSIWALLVIHSLHGVLYCAAKRLRELLQVPFDLVFREKFTAEFFLRGWKNPYLLYGAIALRPFTCMYMCMERQDSWCGCQQCLPSQLPPSCFFLLAFLLIFFHWHWLRCLGRYWYHQPVTVSKTFCYATSPNGSKLNHEEPISHYGSFIFYVTLFNTQSYLKWVIRVCILIHVVICLNLIDLLQNALLEMNKYQTLPGKRTKRSDLNGNREGDGEYLSPVQLSPSHSQSQDYSLSEFRPQMQTHNIILKSSAGKWHRFWDHF